MISHNALADTVTGTIQVGNAPNGISVNPSTGLIYVANSGSNTVSVIDGKTGNVTSTIPVGSHPFDIAADPVTNKIYVTNTFDHSVSVIDGSTNAVEKTMSLGSSDEPYGIGVDSNTDMVYIACQYCPTVWVINGTTDSIVKTVSGPYNNDVIGIDQATDKIYVSGTTYDPYNGVITIDGSTNSVAGNVQTGGNPFYLAVNAASDRIYVSDYGTDSIYMIDGATNTLAGTIQLGATSYGLGIDPQTNKVYVAKNDNTVSIIDDTSNSVIETVPVGSHPWGVAVDSDTDKIYVANSGSNTVSIIDGTLSSAGSRPSSPQSLQASNGNAVVSLSWKAPLTNGGSAVTNYDLYRATSSGSETLYLQLGNVTSYTDNTVATGQEYFYKVTAVNAIGESAESNEASAIPATVPSSPTNLQATSASPTQINLSWTAPTTNGGSQISGYEIERSNSTGASWSVVVADTNSSGTAFSDRGLEPGQTYQYRVSALNAVGTSAPSNTASATTQPVATTRSSPTGVTISSVKTVSGTVSSQPYQLTLTGFSVGAGNNRLLVVGVEANDNNVASITFGGQELKQSASSFHNNDAEFWYLPNPSGTGDIVVTMTGPTSAVVGAYALAGVDQSDPIPTSSATYNSASSSPSVSITPKYQNSLILDLPSIWGGVTLGSPTCAQQWDQNIAGEITGASSSLPVSSLGTDYCGWTASNGGDLWDDVAVEIKAS